MKTYIRRREKNDRLLVLYGDGELMKISLHLSAMMNLISFSFLIILQMKPLVLPEMKTYKKIVLIGWSLGVWAAEYLSPKTGIKADITIAVNGTPIPADDKYGIPLHVFEGTLNNITEENMEKFYLRMFGDKKTFDLNKDKVPHRTIQSLHDELRWMYNRMMEQKESGFRWDYAVTSDSDRVFPAHNLNSYWKKQRSTRHIIVPMAHYFFHNWPSYDDFIRFVESYKKKRTYKKKIVPSIATGL